MCKVKLMFDTKDCHIQDSGSDSGICRVSANNIVFQGSTLLQYGT